MKKLLLPLLLLVTAVLGMAASSVITLGTPRPWRVQVDIAYNADGTVASANPQVYFRRGLTVDGVAQAPVDAGFVTWDSVAKKDETVTITLANGTTAQTTRGNLLAATIAVGVAEYAAAHP
ncbi:MAG TPA: hypothetical protein VGE76_10905 [Opitutaceae bacterium]